MENKVLDAQLTPEAARRTRPVRNRASAGRRPSAGDRLLRAAAEVFAAHGFTGARVRDIVTLARANVAAVNYHFGDKQGLYDATVAHLLGEVRRELAAPADDPREELYRFVLATVEQMCGGGDGYLLARIFLHETMGGSGAAGEGIAHAAVPHIAQLRSIVARIGAGKLTETEITLSAVSVLSQCCCCVPAHAHLARALGRADDEDIAQPLARHIARFSTRAIEGAAIASGHAHS